MENNNSVFDVILKAVVALCFVGVLLLNACEVHKFTKTMEKIELCKENAKQYPTLKNREVMTARQDSLIDSLSG